MMDTRCVLWDFGDTLACQDWLMQAPPGYPAWPDVWNAIARGEDERSWFMNKIDVRSIAQRVSRSLEMPLQEVVDHIRECCFNLQFFHGVMEAARHCPLPQAIVTINSDIFSRYVVPAHGLDQVFPVIVTSWEEQSVDKNALCLEALERLGGGLEAEEVLLIDNLETNVKRWQDIGGKGYVFRGESEFVADLECALPELKGVAF